MAKVLGIFSSKLKGKVGPVSYRNTAGGNVVYQRAASVKNPRSYAQQYQRMIFATASAAYSSMKAICDHSFEGVSSGSKTQQAFMRENLRYLRDRADAALGNFNIKGNPTMVANALTIAKGSLSSLPVDKTLVHHEEKNFSVLIAPSLHVTSDELSVTQLIDAFPFIQPGDQLTFVQLGAVEGADESFISDLAQKHTKFEYARLVLPLDANLKFVSNKKFQGAEGSENLDAISVGIGIGEADGSNTGLAWSFDSINYPEAELMASAIIVSRKVNGVWERSTTMLTIHSATDEFPSTTIVKSFDPSSDLYLNHALD